MLRPGGYPIAIINDPTNSDDIKFTEGIPNTEGNQM